MIKDGCTSEVWKDQWMFYNSDDILRVRIYNCVGSLPDAFYEYGHWEDMCVRFEL